MNDKAFDSINVIPLVDVMLVMLTIVLTTSTFIAVGSLPVQLPSAVNCPTEQLSGAIIEIDRQGQVYLDASPIQISELASALSRHENTTPIMIRSDNRIELQIFVNVMDVVKGLGFSKVSLQTERRG